MTLLTPRARFSLLLPFALAAPIFAQQLIGYVNTRDANVVGASDVFDGHFVLTGSVSVTAKDHTAPVTLSRGGTVNVCQTSVVHLTESRQMTVDAPLLFSLDRGAVEIQMKAAASDAIMTPDLRFTVRNSGPIDLRLRVARNGDTCVENRGREAPTLAVSDPFGESMYELPGGRHVLFEHGSLHEVVDNETTPCGCPDEKGMSVADALLNAPLATPAPKPAPPAASTPPVPAAATQAAAVSAPVQPPPVVVVQAAAPPPASTPATVPAVVPPAAKIPPPAVALAAPSVQPASAPVVVRVAPPVPQTKAAVVTPPPATPKSAPTAPAPAAPVVVVQAAPPAPQTSANTVAPPPATPKSAPTAPAPAPPVVVVEAAPPAPQVTAAVVTPPPATPKPAPAAPVVVVQAPSPVVTQPAAPPVEQAAAAPTEQSVEQVAAIAAARAAALHPFPAAVSEGLAPVPEAIPAVPGNASPAQISDTLSYVAPAGLPAPGGATPAPAASGKKSGSAKSTSATGQATADSAQPTPPHDLAHFIASFFRKLFGRG